MLIHSVGDWPAPLAGAAFLFGLLFGSFANVVGERLPRGESLFLPRSHCRGCGRTLAWYELIPVLSWLGLRGRCRTCHAGIPVRYPLLELAGGVLFATSATVSATGYMMLAWWAFWLLLLCVTACDLVAMRVPDVLSLPGALIMVGLAAATGIQPWRGALAGAVGCAGVLWGIHWLSRGRMGMGDVKLYLSIGGMLGFWGGVLSLVFASFYGTVIGLGLRLTGRLKPRQPIPFVPFITAGVATAAWWGKALIHWYVHVALGLGG
ncbi:type 4 prepilin-like proteins leader peptide-processing enzyme [Alicyclobacillus cellulosilyticus]|uniref:Type 4 prepilin-like proteins leader peptide-processing enzyme n=1 Tax=Alicyclobacillus cellulosilyticus TaxID=1003997 RepID=A0A917NL62_9BACL|nr:A24 family peptidase [Alicyclobacillus cellulosilyticus]GGJ09491.1 type 4 prepilin-like proteins leader peptide-processing enzyme [Alicyclobacillus cellulosilyticus]